MTHSVVRAENHVPHHKGLQRPISDLRHIVAVVLAPQWKRARTEHQTAHDTSPRLALGLEQEHRKHLIEYQGMAHLVFGNPKPLHKPRGPSDVHVQLKRTKRTRSPPPRFPSRFPVRPTLPQASRSDSGQLRLRRLAESNSVNDEGHRCGGPPPFDLMNEDDIERITFHERCNSFGILEMRHLRDSRFPEFIRDGSQMETMP